MEKVAKVITYLYHPLIMPSLGILVLFNSGTYLSYLPGNIKWSMLLIVFLCTFLIPLAFIPFFMYQKFIMNIHLEQRQERYIPLAVSFILYLFCYYLIYRISIPKLFHAFILSSIVALVVTALVNLRMKISIHMIGSGGIVALITFVTVSLKVDLLFYLALSILFAGLAGTARLILRAHSPAQVYLGFLTGFSVVFLTLYLY